MNAQESKPSTVKQPLHLDEAVEALLEALRGIERALNALSTRMERLPKEVAAELARQRAADPRAMAPWSASDGLPGS